MTELNKISHMQGILLACTVCWMTFEVYGNVFIYRTYHIVSWRFRILLWVEIGRQHVQAPLAAAISPYDDVTHTPNPLMNVKDRWNQR